MKTTMLAIGIALFCSILGAIAQICFKLGSEKLDFSLKQIKNYVLIFGLFLYGISSILFIFALRQGELSVLYPMIAASYVWVNLLAAKFLNEKMNWYKISGTILILTGIVLINLG